MADHPSPVAAELEEARDLALLPDAEQLELIRDAVPGRDAATAVEVARRRGRGRPPGALNKRNAKFRDQILVMCGGQHPALGLARTATTPVELLAAQLKCSLLEAAQLAIRAGAELMPYLESKQPVDVNVTRRNDVVLIMPGAGVSPEQVEAIRADVDAQEGIDWTTVEIGDVLPSLSGEPMQGVSPEPGE